MRLQLRRGGGSFAARFLLRRRSRLGDGTGVENAKGGSVEGDLKSIVDSMVTKKMYFGLINEYVMWDAIFFVVNNDGGQTAGTTVVFYNGK